MAASIEQTAASWSKLGDNYATSIVHKSGPSLAKLIQLARPQSTDLCLDIGTGTGHTAAELAKYAHKVWGLDPSHGMRLAAEKIYADIDNLGFIDGTSEKTGFPDDCFDIVTARHTLHHHPSMPNTLAEIYRILKANGRFVLVDEITPKPELNDWYHQLEITRDPTHKRSYYLSEWQDFLKDAGFEWIVGDSKTVYHLDIEKWINRMEPSREQANTVRQLFLSASEFAKETFNIQIKDNKAISFDMPMAIILAIKPARNED